MDIIENTLDYIKNSYEVRRQIESGQASFDSLCNVIEDGVARAKFELRGLNTDGVKVNQMLGKESFDDGSSFQVPDTVHFDQIFREQEYADIDILKNLQQTSTIPVGAVESRFFIDDYVGEYKRAKASATDLPTISLKGTPYPINVEMGHGSINWDQNELDQAAFSGRPLDMIRVRAIRRAYLEDIYNLVINGNEKLKGLLSGDITISQVADTVANPKAVAGAALKYWINKLGREIVGDLIAARKAVALATQSRWGGPIGNFNTGVEGNPSAFTCLVSQKAYFVLLEQRMHSVDGGTNLSVWAHLHSPDGILETGIDRYVVVHDFDSAFNSGTDAGFMILPNSSDAYSFEKPLDLTAKPVQFKDLIMKVPYYDYFAGLKLIRDGALIGYRTIAPQ